MNRAADLVRSLWVESLALAFAIAGSIEIALNPTSADGTSTAPGWLLPLAGPVLVAPLIVSRRFPFAAPVATVAIAVALTFVGNGRMLAESAVVLLLLSLVAWLFGRLDTHSAAIGFLLLVAVVVAVNVQAEQSGLGDYLFPIVFFSLFWGASAVIKGREERTREAEERAQRLSSEQEAAAILAVAEERQRIGRELHDVIAHSVSVMTVQAGAVRRLLLPEQERERQALETVEATGRQALTEMRRLVGLLREKGATPDFAPQPSLGSIDVLIGTVREAGLPVELEVEGVARELPPGVDLSAYRLVQEALTNTLKYAGPANAWVVLRWRDNELELEVANDGRTDGATNGVGHGLAGMRERVSLCGGTLETGPRDGGGFVVRCHLPLEATA